MGDTYSLGVSNGDMVLGKPQIQMNKNRTGLCLHCTRHYLIIRSDANHKEIYCSKRCESKLFDRMPRSGKQHPSRGGEEK